MHDMHVEMTAKLKHHVNLYHLESSFNILVGFIGLCVLCYTLLHCRWLCADNANSVKLTALPLHSEQQDNLPRTNTVHTITSTVEAERGGGCVSESAPVLVEVDVSQPHEQDSSITNKYLRQLR